MTTTLDTFKINPSDGLFRKLGSLNIEWPHVIWELVNNSIQAADDRDLDLNLKIIFDFDSETEKLNQLTVQDKSGGIKRSDISVALEPAAFRDTERTLNEHSMGLNIAIEHLTQGKGSYELRSHIGDNSFIISDRLSFHKEISIHSLDSNEKHGVELIFSDFEDQFGDLKFPNGGSTNALWYFWTDTCAKYRYKYESFMNVGRDFKIEIVCNCGSRSRNRKYTPVKPVLKNPLNGKNEWVTEFVLEDQDVKIHYKIGAASLPHESYNKDAGHVNIWNSIHPYRVKTGNFGLDLIYQDVVLERNTLYKDKRNSWWDHSLLRGEKIILSGGESFFTKDGMKETEAIRFLDEKAKKIFNGQEPHPLTGDKTNFFDNFINRKNHDRTTPCAPEKIVKFRHREILECFMGEQVSQELNLPCGRIDMMSPTTVYEHKIKSSKPDDIMQLLKYLLFCPEHSGELWADGHTDASKETCTKVNELLAASGTNQKIVLKDLTEQLKNPNLTDDEKELL